MGTYNISPDEFEEAFEELLSTQQGDVAAWVVAECWERLAKKNMWNDRLVANDIEERNILQHAEEIIYGRSEEDNRKYGPMGEKMPSHT